MDANRFDTIAKDLIRSTSRRRALGVFLAGVLGLTSLLGHEQAEAKSCQKACEKKKDCQKKKDKKAKKKCKKQCKKSCQKGGFCAGKNSCSDNSAFTTCQAGGAFTCACFVRADTGESVCARADAGLTTDCSATPCPAGETCVDLRGGQCDDPGNPGGLKCAQACPNPMT